MTTYIKYFGIERSCSNVTERYVLDTYEDTYSAHAIAWKHGPPDVQEWAEKNIQQSMKEAEDDQELGMYEAFMDDELHYIICTKNPFSWLKSYIDGLKNGEVLPDHYKRHDDMMQNVIDMDRKYMHHLNDPEYWRQFLNKYKLRHYQWWNFSKERRDRSMIVRHEDLLVHFRETIERIGERFGLQKSSEIERVKKEVSATCGEQKNDFDMGHYMEEKYMDELTEKQKKMVSESMDWDFLATTPYSYHDKYQSGA